MNDLRQPLVAALQTLATDVAVERYGDPHVGFVVLIHPDREPHVICLTDLGSGAHDITTMKFSGEQKSLKRVKRRGFTVSELSEAQQALYQAWLYLSVASGRSGMQTLGEIIADQIRVIWEVARQRPITQALERAQHEARYTAMCEACKRRFTPRGLPMHQRTCRSLQAKGKT